VTRVGGAFHELGMNFMNAELGTGEDGGRYAAMLGGDPRAEKHMAEVYRKLGFDEAYFLNRSMTAHTLSQSGGIGCRTKNEGQVVAPAGETLRM
jgi:hypothetical protein